MSPLLVSRPGSRSYRRTCAPGVCPVLKVHSEARKKECQADQNRSGTENLTQLPPPTCTRNMMFIIANAAANTFVRSSASFIRMAAMTIPTAREILLFVRGVGVNKLRRAPHQKNITRARLQTPRSQNTNGGFELTRSPFVADVGGPSQTLSPRAVWISASRLP